jgi:DnaJ-class molecular chaperone
MSLGDFGFGNDLFTRFFADWLRREPRVLRGKGLPGHREPARGDLLLRVRVMIPVKPTAEERRLYESLRRISEGES